MIFGRDGGATAYLVGGKINSRIRLTSAKVGVEVEAEPGNATNLSQTIFWSKF